MSADVLNAFGQAWKSILALAFLIGLFLFRGPINGFISRLKSVKVGDKELQATDKIDQNEREIAVSQQIQEESVVDVEDGSVETGLTTDEAFVIMIKAFEDSNFTVAKQAYEEQWRAAQSDEERCEIEATYISATLEPLIQKHWLDFANSLLMYQQKQMFFVGWRIVIGALETTQRPVRYI